MVVNMGGPMLVGTGSIFDRGPTSIDWTLPAENPHADVGFRQVELEKLQYDCRTSSIAAIKDEDISLSFSGYSRGPCGFLLDGKDWVYWGGSTDGQTMDLPFGCIRVCDLQAIAEAKKVEVELDGKYYLMRPEQQKAIGEFLKVIGIP